MLLFFPVFVPGPGSGPERDWSEVSSPAHGRGRGRASHLGLVVFAGVDFTEMPVLLWRRQVLNGVEVELRLKII